MTTTPNMLAWALRYADHGFHVIPCHEPVFNDPHGYLCTCEAWRHTGECKRRDEERRAKGQQPLYLEPHQHCANPGKHPRGLEHGLKQASNDPAIIRHWWRKYPNANIAHVPGMAGMVMLDGDTYKAEYAGDEMALTPDELHTLTVRSGKGGTHLYYRKHEGATYTNAAGTLPPGVDVRGDSGYALLPPSINSGGRYSWEDGHNPGDLAPQLLPQRIHDILITASAKTARTSARFSSPARWDGTPSTEAPDLATWKLSLRVRHLIAHPAAKGERSEADAKVVQALVYAGATDDQILSVFEHNPCGTGGKFAESGRPYLQRTISAARAYAEEHPRRPDVSATIAAARARLHSIDLAEYVPADKQAARGYQTRERDLAVADAILDVYDEYGSLDGPLGHKQLRRMCNFGGKGCVMRAMDCLESWFIRPLPLEDGDPANNSAHRYELVFFGLGEVVAQMDPLLHTNTVEGGPSAQQVYSQLRKHDAFCATTTPITSEMIAEREAAGNPYSTRYTLTAVYRRRLQAVLPAAGRTGLVIINALVNAGGHIPYRELVGLGGRKKHTISRAVTRLAELQFITLDEHRGVDLRDDWREWLDKIEDLMPTAGNGRRRIARDALTTLDTCEAKEKEAAEAGTAVPGWVAHRKRQAQRELVHLAPTFWRLHKTQIGAAPVGHVHTGPNGQLLEEQLPELRRLAYGRAA